MAKKKLPKPSASELELLQILWRLGPATVKTVHEEAMRDLDSPKAMTTTLKVMQVMEQKGLVRRQGTERPQRFSAVIQKHEAQTGLLRDVLARAFQGDARQLVLSALQESDVSEEDIREIRALIDARKEGGES